MRLLLSTYDLDMARRRVSKPVERSSSNCVVFAICGMRNDARNGSDRWNTREMHIQRIFLENWHETPLRFSRLERETQWLPVLPKHLEARSGGIMQRVLSASNGNRDSHIPRDHTRLVRPKSEHASSPWKKLHSSVTGLFHSIRSGN